MATFVRRADLERHSKTRHDESAMSRFSCPFRKCDLKSKSFPRKDKFIEHIEAVHGDIFDRLNLSLDSSGRSRVAYLLQLYSTLCDQDGEIKWTDLVSSKASPKPCVSKIPSDDMNDVLLVWSQCTASSSSSEYRCSSCNVVTKTCSEFRCAKLSPFSYATTILTDILL
jgi:hypothetical protein